MGSRPSPITFQGNPLTIMGQGPFIGAKIPNFSVLDNGLSPVSPQSFLGSTCLWVAVPSLDTPVCDLETRKFEEKAMRLSDTVQICVVSMDLPFAQKRWCGAAGLSRVKTFSDHREASFGHAFGCLIEELRLLARALFLVDKGGILRYEQWVQELTMEPNYEEALEALQHLK